MSSLMPRERLSRLVELATETDLAARRALVDGLAELLLDWPDTYPVTMREPFEALLEKSLQNVDATSRAALAERFLEHNNTPLHLLNLLVFDAAPDTKSAILMRNALTDENHLESPRIVTESILLASVRSGSIDMLPSILASHFRIAQETATQILADDSGWMLATLCKGACLNRAAFSALAVLARPEASPDESYRRMAAYDAVPLWGASALLASWREAFSPSGSTAKAA